MNGFEIASSVRDFILERFPASRRRLRNDTDPLLESGIIDSLGVLDVVAFVESTFNITVDDEDLSPDNFQSVAQMAAYVERKRNVSG